MAVSKTRYAASRLNAIDRFHPAKAVVDHVPWLAGERVVFDGFVSARLAMHDSHIREHGEDMPEICNWKWQVD